MIWNALLQFFVFALVTGGLALPCSIYLARLFGGETIGLNFILGPIERLIGKVLGSQFSKQQTWGSYLFSVLFFNALGGAFLYVLLRHQGELPWNPQGFGDVSPDLAFNIAASFVTNTNWQSYAGEATLSAFSQMVGLTAQNYLSAATGIAIVFAVVRGFVHKENPALGNFYADVVRITLYVLLPLALVLSLLLIGQGVPQNMMPYVQASTLEDGQQVIAQGPVASQVAIKILGANGGGFFNVNGAHPYENPTPLSNFIQVVSMLFLPIAMILAFGRIVKDRRQSWSLLATMTLLFLIMLGLCAYFEQTAHPALAALNIDQTVGGNNIGGNMEGKETRFGIFGSVLWTVATTATSNGAVNSMLDSYMPLGGLVPLFGMLVGEVIYGGVDNGLCGILIYVFITVFLARLLVGRSAEYLGKRIEAHEIKLAIMSMFLLPACILGFGCISLVVPAGANSITAYGPHGLTQVIYAYASAAANNGSAFAGLNSNTTFQNIMLAVVMLIGRFGIFVPTLAIAGALAAKKIVPATANPFPTHGGVFVFLLAGVIVLFGGLIYFPMIALGPLAEHLSLFAR